MPAAGGDPAANHLTLFVADDGAITYDLASRKLGHSTGKLEPNSPAGDRLGRLAADGRSGNATREAMDGFYSRRGSPASGDLPDGIRIRVEQAGQNIEQWIPAGWQVNVPTVPNELQMAYGWKQIPLPIGLELTDFEVQRNEGSDSPAGFKSTLRVTGSEGQTATGQCWMNNPFSFPGAAWRTWTGLTYKMSQASWNPDNLGQSTIQILRDPGWLAKWIGSLLIVTGVFPSLLREEISKTRCANFHETNLAKKQA